MIVAIALWLAGERVALGVWRNWAALRDTPPPRCFAIARPLRADGTTDRRGGHAAAVARQGPGRTMAVFFRLTRPRGAGAPLTLAIGGRRFALVGARHTAHAPDPATDRAIVAAMRGALSMTLTTLDGRGREVSDTYPLAGAATAIDAAQLGCAER